MKRLLAVLLLCLLLCACAEQKPPMENPFTVYSTRVVDQSANGMYVAISTPEGYPAETLFEEIVLLTENSGAVVEAEVQFIEDGTKAFTGLEEGSVEYLKAKVRRDKYLRLLKITKVHRGEFEEGAYVLLRCAVHDESHMPPFLQGETYLLCLRGMGTVEDYTVYTETGAWTEPHTSGGIFYLERGMVFPAADAEEYDQFTGMTVKEFLKIWDKTADKILPAYEKFLAERENNG